MISGAFAGGIAAALTTPLDVCKTLLNTQQGQVSWEVNSILILIKYQTSCKGQTLWPPLTEKDYADGSIHQDTTSLV